FRQADIQSIPYEDDAFDAVIANMMLYHVPDLHRGLAEVRRVLRPGGWFYCATYGQNGILAYVRDLFAAHGNGEVGNDGFTLQNGAEHLGRYFSVVEKRLYDDRLEVTDTQDLVDYIFSMNGIAELASVSAEELYRVLDARKEDGVITIPKEYGMFLARK
ncbi:MAG: class I SAM-dependent methyltransferase, partial [Eubacteriales bacterium]